MKGLNNPIGIKSIEPNQNPFITNPYRHVSGAVGGWKELGRTTLGSTADTVSVSSLGDKRYFMVLCDNRTTGAVRMNMRFNSDSGSNYSERWSAKGATDSTQISQNKMQYGQSYVNEQGFSVHNIANLTNKEKLMMAHIVSDDASTGAGTAPYRNEYISKWVPSTASDVINEIAMYNTSAGSWNIGAECVVLGWDPADTHTTNFWEELASVELGSAGNDLSSGTISAKKYLWVQAYAKATGGSINNGFRFNSDTGSNYANRRSVDGATDATQINTSSACDDANLDSAYERFYNMFIVNNSSNEKLSICHVVQQNASGAANAPRRGEYVGKWANTSNQITDITLHNFSGGNLDTGSIIKVWGSD